MRQIELPFRCRNHIAKSGGTDTTESVNVVRQIDQNLQTWGDTEPPSTIGSVQYVGGVASAYIYAVLVLQAANRHDDGGVGKVGPVGFNWLAWLSTFVGRGPRSTETRQKPANQAPT